MCVYVFGFCKYYWFFLLLLPWLFRNKIICLAPKILHFYHTYKQFWCNEKMSRIRRIDTTSHLLRPSRSGVVSCNQRGNIIMHRLQFFFACVTGGTGTRHTSLTYSRELHSARKTSSAWRNTREWQSQMQSRLHTKLCCDDGSPPRWMYRLEKFYGV